MGTGRDDAASLEARVHDTLLRCVEWSHEGRHRKVLAEVERLLPWARPHPQVEAQLLVWKAQALLSMGLPERALPAATRSWELDDSPHACHLMANALASLGNADEAEDLLRMGWTLFPEAANLPVQLSMMLTDQGRLPEALETLQDLPPERLPDDIQVFLYGLRANLLATVGRWREARDLIEEGLDLHPESTLLTEAQDSLRNAWLRSRAEQALAASWAASLEPVAGIDAEVDDAVVRCGAVTERPHLVVLAARRLWRSFARAVKVRPHAPDPWAAALVLAIMELDGQQPSASAMARSLGVSASTVRSALRRLRHFLGSLEPRLARRSFAATANPRLDEPPPARDGSSSCGTLVSFPSRETGTDPQ